jgi:hypothetical protein
MLLLFRKYWRGDGSPTIALWLFGILGVVAIQLLEILGFMFFFAKTITTANPAESRIYDAYILGDVLALLAHAFLVGIMTWRCSLHARRVTSRYIFRGIAILWVAYFTISAIVEIRTFLVTWLL